MKQPPAKRGYVCVGVITGVRGLRGQVTLKPFCDNASDIVTFTEFTTSKDVSLTPKKFGETKHTVWCAFDEVPLRRLAEEMKGEFLYVPRKALPKLQKGEHYQADIIGLPLKEKDGEELGTVDDVYSNGVQMVLASGKRSVIFLPEFCKVKKDHIELTEQGLELFNLT